MDDDDELTRLEMSLALQPLTKTGYFIVTFGDHQDTYIVDCFDDPDDAEREFFLLDAHAEHKALITVEAGESALYQLALKTGAMKSAWERRN